VTQEDTIVMNKKRVLWAGAALLLSGAAARAEVLITPPLVAEGDLVLDCYLVNVSRTVRAVTIEVLNRDGEVVETVDTELGPFEEDVARTTSDQLGRVCRFKVEGRKGLFRGSILVREDGIGAISALPAF
jgi:hypothetical protein